MNILLIQPAITVKRGEVFGVTPPLSLAYLAAIAEKSGHTVKVIDSIIEGYECKSIVNDKFIRIGLPYNEIENILKKFYPDVVGISCPFSLMDYEMRKMARIVKIVNPKIKVVVGGAHPSSNPGFVIEDPNIDCLILGEGEKTFSELLEKIEKNESFENLRGIWFKINKRIYRKDNKKLILDLDSIPFPAWHLFPIEKYIKNGKSHGSKKRKRFIPTITSRGCPGSCSFCSIHSVWGYKWRARSPENVIREIEEIMGKYKIREFHFEDDNITLSRKRMNKICKLIIERNLDITWSTPNGVAINTLDFKLLNKMKRSGCFQLNFGIESGDPYILKNIINKKLDLIKVKDVIQSSKKLGIWTHGFFVIGFPEESINSINKTINFAKESDLDSANFFIATPYPGTPLYNEAKSMKLLENDLDLTKLRTMDSIMNSKFFKSDEIIKIQKTAYSEFIKYRLKREIFDLNLIKRIVKIKSFDDISFLNQKIGRAVKVFS